MSNVLILVEQTAGTPKKLAMASIRFGQDLVAKTGGKLTLLIAGRGASAAAGQVSAFGAEKVLVAESPALEHYLAESYTKLVEAAAKQCGASVIAASASSMTKDLLPRVAARLDAGMASDVLAIVDGKTFKRPMWAGNVVATVELTTPVRVCTVRGTEFGKPNAGATSSVEKLEVAIDSASLKTRFVSNKEVKSERPDATVADKVVSAGRGIKSAEGFKVIEQLADALGAGVGASRAICDAGWVPNDLQIGQTGKVVAPDLYFAIGISGAIQHIAGMKGSKVIVAINKDPEAPIFQVADYGLVADLFTAVPELTERVKKLRG